MQIFSSPHHTAHDPPFEIIDGQTVPYFESPRRVEIITAALAAAGFPEPTPVFSADMEPILAVHSAEYVDYLARAYNKWVTSGKPPEAVLPSTMPLGGMQTRGSSPTAEAGRYIFDLSAPVVAGTFGAAACSASAALAGAQALCKGEQVAYALCRPPGHHAMPALAGGYCYLNNAAIAANFLAASPDETRTWTMAPATVAILDIDFHHGNGTQAIFYERPDVFFASIHADPDREYPYFAGFADERGAGAGEGYNLNIPLPAYVDDAGYLEALDQALETLSAYSPRFLVVSAGFDTFIDDPLGDFVVTTEGFNAIGARIAGLGLPTLFVQEGGYAVEELGANVVSLLRGFEEQ